MNDVIIKVNSQTGLAYKKDTLQKIGNQHQNLQNKLKFEMSEFVEGIAWLEYEIDNVKKYALMDRYENGYQIDIKSCLLISNHVNVDIKITEEENPNGIPVFVSTIVKFAVAETINAKEEEPDEYPSWQEAISSKLAEFESAEKLRNENEEARKANEVSRDANEKAREEYIEEFKQDVENGVFKGDKGDTGEQGPQGEQGIQGPQGDSYILTDEDKETIKNEIVTNANSDFNQNVNNKIEELNTVAQNQLNAYNTNADDRMNEYNTQAEELLNYAENMDNIVPKNEVSGELVQVDDALNYKLFEVTAEAAEVSEQDTTIGKNLLPLPTSETKNGITLSLNSDNATFKLIGTTTEITSFMIDITDILVDDKTYSISKNSDLFTLQGYEYNSENWLQTLFSVSENSSVTFKYSKNSSATNVYVRIYIKKGVTLALENVQLMLEEEELVTEFEPYTGCQASPNLDYPQEIETIKELTLKIQQDEEITSVPIDLKSNEIVKLSDNAKDILQIDKKGNISLVKNIKKVNFNFNNGKWFYADDYHRLYIPFVDLTDLDFNQNQGVIMSTHFELTSWSEFQTDTIKTGMALSTNFLQLKNENWTSIEQAIQELSEKNPLFYFPTNQSEVVDLGNLSELIKTFKGKNSIWIESNLETTIYVVYAKDLNKEIGNISELLEVI